MKIFIWVLFCTFILNESAKAFCPSAPPSCSYAAINDNLKEMDSSLIFTSFNDTCKASIPSGKARPSNDKIYTAMMEDSRITNYVNPNILSCFKNSPGSEEQKIRALSRYSYTQMRFDKSAEELQDYLAFADTVNGKVPLDKKDCTQEAPEMTKTVESCQRIKNQCTEASPTAAQDLVNLYENEFKSRDVPGMNAKIKQLKAQISMATHPGRGRVTVSPETLKKLQNELAAKEIEIELFYSSFPWARQSTYAQSIRKGKKPAEALRLQITENANLAKDQLKDINKASSCMLRNNCDPDDITDALKKTPRINTDSYSLKKGDTKENNLARSAVTNYLNYNRCLDDRVDDWDQTNDKVIHDSTLVLSIATIPLTMGGSLALSGASLGGRALVSAASVGSRTFGIAKSAVAIGTVASAALAAPQVITAVNHCGKAVADLNENKTSTEKNSCSITDSQAMVFKRKYDDCVMQAVMATLSVGGAGLGLKTLATAGKTAGATNAATGVEGASEKVQKFLDASKQSATNSSGGRFVASEEQLALANNLKDPERVEVAKRILGTENSPRALDAVQEKAILEAHNIGDGFGKYSKTDLLQKRKVLKNAGFSDKDIESLMRNGVTGKIDQVSIGVGTNGAKELKTVADKYEHADNILLQGDFKSAESKFSNVAEEVSTYLNGNGRHELSAAVSMERPMVLNENISKLVMADRRVQQNASEKIIATAQQIKTKYGVEVADTLKKEFSALKKEADSQAARITGHDGPKGRVGNFGNTRYDEKTRKWIPMEDSQIQADAAYKAYKANQMRQNLAHEAFHEKEAISEEMYNAIMAECEAFEKANKNALKRVIESLKPSY